MHKFSILFFFIFYSLIGLSQDNAKLNIHNLTKALATSTGIERIKCLNRLVTFYYYFNEDSGFLYARKAYNEAIALNSPQGKASSLFNAGMIKMYETNFEQAEKHFRESFSWFEKSVDVHGLGEAILFTAISLHWQIKFDEAIVTYNLALPYLQKAGDSADIANTLGMIGLAYQNKGDYETSLEYEKKCLKICKSNNYADYLIYSYYYLSQLYKSVGDYETALKYLILDRQLLKTFPEYNLPPDVLIAEVYCLNHQYDSALYYVKPYLNFSAPDYAARAVLCMGEIYLMQHHYKDALQNFLPFLNGTKKTQEVGILQALLGTTKAYAGMQMDNETLWYAQKLLQISTKVNARQYTRDAAYFLSIAFANKKRFDSSYSYQKLYILMKDSVASNQYLFKLANYKEEVASEQKKSEFQLLQKDQKIKDQQLSKEYLQKKILLIGIIFLILLGFIILRIIVLKNKDEKNRLNIVENELQIQRLESEKTKIKLEQQATELEMQALRAQMNPHFIFNCLSSINRFILINKIDEASDYLTKFSRLIRMALHNSEKSLITLESELEALRLYLDLERLRFKNAFNYSITFINAIDINTVYIPPMLIQPFVENAIWHGLMHKKGIGQLEIQLCATDKKLTCAIIDNGIGRNMAAALNTKSAEKNKSMGVDITAGRLALLNKSKKEAAVFNIEDLVNEQGEDCGTKVILTMPYKDLTEVA